MRILLLGANGQVGYELHRSLAPLGEIVAATRAGTLPGGAPCEVARLEDVVRVVREEAEAGEDVQNRIEGGVGEGERAHVGGDVAHVCLRCVREEVAGREQPPYPPLVRLANVVFSGLTEADTEQLAQRGADWLRRLVKAHAPESVTVIGPAPCAVERSRSETHCST